MHVAATLAEASRLQLERDSVRILVVVHQARRHAVVAGGAPLLQLGDRRVGSPCVLLGGLEVLFAPARFHLLQRPRAAGENLGQIGACGLGRDGHQEEGY
jgi:hypothetical protein